MLVDDLLKVQERLNALGTKNTELPVESQLYIIESCLRAAQRRGDEFRKFLDDRSIPLPNTFIVMCQDVSDALAEVGQMIAAAKPIPVSFLRRPFRRVGQARSSAT